MLKIVNITFEYITNTKVLRGLNGEFNKGLNIVFANRGEGKTTLLDLLLFPKKGQSSIFLNGEKLTKQMAKAEISVVTRDWFLKENKTVKENFDGSLHQNKLTKSFLESVGFFEIEKVKTSELSFPQKFEIAVIRALKKAPSLLVLDSPFLENREEKQLFHALKQVVLKYQTHNEKPLCVLLLSRPFDAGEKCVSLLLGGSIIHKNSWENISRKPATTLVAVNFAKYPNNVFSKGEENFYVDGDKVKIGSEFEGVVASVENGKMLVEFEKDDLEILEIAGYKTGDKITLDIPKESVTKLDINTN